MRRVFEGLKRFASALFGHRATHGALALVYAGQYGGMVDKSLALVAAGCCYALLAVRD